MPIKSHPMLHVTFVMGQIQGTRAHTTKKAQRSSLSKLEVAHKPRMIAFCFGHVSFVKQGAETVFLTVKVACVGAIDLDTMCPTADWRKYFCCFKLGCILCGISVNLIQSADDVIVALKAAADLIESHCFYHSLTR